MNNCIDTLDADTSLVIDTAFEGRVIFETKLDYLKLSLILAFTIG